MILRGDRTTGARVQPALGCTAVKRFRHSNGSYTLLQQYY